MNGKVLSFYLGEWYLGVDISLVREVTRYVDYTPVPDSTAEVVGLLNLRGQIITLLDLEILLETRVTELEKKKACIILKPFNKSDDQVGFLIDKAGDVLDVSDDICESPPANLRLDNGLLREVAKVKERLLMILDISKTINP